MNVSPPASAPKSSEPGPPSFEANGTLRPVPKGFRIGGFLQTQFESNQLSSDQLQSGGAPYNQDRFSLRRGRVRVDHGWEYANASLELDANTTRGMSVGIRRAEGSLLYRGDNGVNLPPLVMLTLAVTDLPFGFELMESARVRPFMERSLGSSALFPTEMDVGAKLSGAVSFLRYAFAVTNGEPPRHPEPLPARSERRQRLFCRVGVETQPLPVLAISGGTSFYQGKAFHAGSDASKPPSTGSTSTRTARFRPNELQGVTGTVALPSLNSSAGRTPSISSFCFTPSSARPPVCGGLRRVEFGSRLFDRRPGLGRERSARGRGLCGLGARRHPLRASGVSCLLLRPQLRLLRQPARRQFRRRSRDYAFADGCAPASGHRPPVVPVRHRA